MDELVYLIRTQRRRLNFFKKKIPRRAIHYERASNANAMREIHCDLTFKNVRE